MKLNRNDWHNFRQGTDWFEIMTFVVILGVILVGAFSVADTVLGQWQPGMRAIVVDRSHDNARITTSVGTVVGADGKVGTVLTSGRDSEKWTVIVRVNGKVVSVQTSANVWAECEKGRELFVQYRRARFTGRNVGWRTFRN